MLERLLRDDDEVVLVWYLMGWLHVLMDDPDSAHFYLEQANKVRGHLDRTSALRIRTPLIGVVSRYLHCIYIHREMS